MIVISDTTAVTYLYQIGRLDLLRELYGDVVVPQAVADELAIAHPDLLAAPVAQFITVRRKRPRIYGSIARSYAGLHRGELEAIALSLSEPTQVLIVDEAAARAVAVGLSIPITGTLGMLRAAKQAGLIRYVRPLVTDLLAAGFRAAPQLITGFLKSVGE